MKNILFDWSGTVKDAFHSHHWVVNWILRHYGIKELSPAELRANWEEPFMSFYQKYIPSITLQEEERVYREGLLDKNYPQTGPFPGIVALLKKLKKNGSYLAVVSSDLNETLLAEIRRFGLTDIFTDVVSGLHEKAPAVNGLVEKRKLNQEQTFIVGDSHNEIMAGKMSGIKTVAVTWGFTPEQKLIQKNPDYLAHDLSELSQIID